VPTADYRVFTDLAAAEAWVGERGAPIVVKASGLAAGKGALVCGTVEEAREALHALMEDLSFGEAGREVVVEEFMEGEELSIFGITDGEEVVLLVPSQDHKRVGEGDTGPNTGGMGAYSPAPVMTDALIDEVMTGIIRPTVGAMAEAGTPYKGVLYAGLMITAEGPKLIE